MLDISAFKCRNDRARFDWSMANRANNLRN
jgi:hypothetical protein